MSHEEGWTYLGRPVEDLNLEEMADALVTMGKAYNRLCDQLFASKNATYDMMRLAIERRTGDIEP